MKVLLVHAWVDLYDGQIAPSASSKDALGKDSGKKPDSIDPLLFRV